MIDRITNALSRRHVLLGLAASATAATATGATAAPQENPELVSLADALPATLAAYVAARDDVARIVAEWSPQWPVPAPEIVRYGEGTRLHAGIDGAGIATLCKRGVAAVDYLGTPESFEASAAYHARMAAIKAKTKSKRGMKFQVTWAERERAAIAPARAYWSEVERITEASGIEAATAQRTVTLDALHSHVDAIMRVDDWTITGAIIKAQALGAWGEADRFRRSFNTEGPAWADLLASSILRHAGGAA